MTSTSSPGLITRLRIANPKVTVSKDPDALRIGILGAANIAPSALIYPAKSMRTINVVSVAARNHDRAKEFAKKHGIPSTHATYDALISDPSIDCIYNPLPNGLHYEWTKKALEAGKHVLLEKPSASNASQARELFELAQAKNLVLLEAFHYRFHPASIFFKDLIRKHVSEGHRIERVESVMSFMSFFSLDDIRFNYKLAGGVTMDAGSNTANPILYFTGLDVVKVDSAVPKIVAEDIDGRMDATMTLSNGGKATLIASLTNPWLSIQTWKEFTPRFVVETDTKVFTFGWFLLPGAYHYFTVKDKVTGKTENLPKVYREGYQTYRYQLEAFVQGVRSGGGDEATIPGWVSGENSIATMEVLDSIYRAAGMKLRQ
ncbi:hypothetical protein CPC16_008083 [Podila verticillata]|nr:hypothetical protein CPC16_008083 [Podila verticillata]